MEYLLFGVTVFLAFGNGANDNFKGFATVWGTKSLSYRKALLLATLATAAGSCRVANLYNARADRRLGRLSAFICPYRVCSIGCMCFLQA